MDLLKDKKVVMAPPTGQYLWHDAENNKYYMIDEAKGTQILCNQAGKFPTKCINDKSGFMGFNERQELAKSYTQMGCEVPKYNRSYANQRNYYTPQSDKFEGYVQFPTPQVPPYTNQINDKAQNTERKKYEEKQKKSISDLTSKVLNSNNLSFASKTMTNGFVKQCNVGSNYLTGRMNILGVASPKEKTFRETTTAFSGYSKNQGFDRETNLNRPQTANKPQSMSSELQLVRGMKTSASTIQAQGKQRVLEDFSKFTNKWNEDREKRIVAGQMPNPEGREETRVKSMIKVLTKNEGGKSINGRPLQTPTAAIIAKKKDLDGIQKSLQGTFTRNQSQYLNTLRTSMAEGPMTMIGSRSNFMAQSQANFSPKMLSTSNSVLQHDPMAKSQERLTTGFRTASKASQFRNPESSDLKSLYETTQKMQSFQDYAIKTKYFEKMNPFLSRKYDLTTKFEYSIYPEKAKAEDQQQQQQAPPDPKAKPQQQQQPPAAKNLKANPVANQPNNNAAQNSLITKEIKDYQIQSSEDIERDPTDLKADVHCPWIYSGIQTMSQMNFERLDKELHEKGYIPPQQKPIRSNTKGRFNVQVKGPSELFVVDKNWEKTANPVANHEYKRREQWDIDMLKKKRNQKLLKEKLVEEQMRHSYSKSPMKQRI